VQQVLPVQQALLVQVSLAQRAQQEQLVRQAQLVHKEQQFKFLAHLQLSVRCKLPTLQAQPVTGIL
jgi:hypothetical protein